MIDLVVKKDNMKFGMVELEELRTDNLRDTEFIAVGENGVFLLISEDGDFFFRDINYLKYIGKTYRETDKHQARFYAINQMLDKGYKVYRGDNLTSLFVELVLLGIIKEAQNVSI